MKRKLANVMIAVLLLLALVFGYLAFKEYKPLIESDIQTDAIKEVAVEESNDPFDRYIDFESLKKINKDIIGWIYIPNTSIDYPIFRGTTTNEYLYKDSEGRYSPIGSIFTFADSSDYLSDANQFIFGHSMREFKMFGELRMYREDSNYRKNNNTMYIYTERKTSMVKLFSVFTCNQLDDIFKHKMELGTPEYLDRVSDLQSRNQYKDINQDIDVDWVNSQIYSLSTCHGTVGTPYRLLVNWVTVKEKYLIS